MIISRKGELFPFSYDIIEVGEVMKILLVEDNLSIVKGLVYTLKQNNYEVVDVGTVSDAKKYLEVNVPDLIILDIGLPDGDGVMLYKNDIKNIPTIFLTAKDTEDDIVSCLEMGAADYMTKPFSTRELLARIKRILVTKSKGNKITIKDITFDLEAMQVLKDNELINLTSLELKILALLFTNLNKVVTRSYIVERIWEWTGNDVFDNTVTVYMKRIREKLGTDIIVTLKGIGYRVDDEK